MYFPTSTKLGLSVNVEHPAKITDAKTNFLFLNSNYAKAAFIASRE